MFSLSRRKQCASRGHLESEPASRALWGILLALLIAATGFAVVGCGGGSMSSGSDAGDTSAVTITTPPASQTVAAGRTATFVVTASGAE